MLKKVLAVVLTVAMVLGTMSFAAFAEDTVSVWDGSVDTSWFDSSKTEFDIYTAAQFAGIAKLVNDGTTKFSGMTVNLMTDIDLNQIDWDPIGSNDNDRSYRGSFNGNNHTISNLWVSEADDFLGLFGYAGVGGDQGVVVYKDFTVHNATVVSTVTNGHGGSYVGGVFGNSRVATITNVDLTGEINIQGYGYVGGIVGHGYVTMSDCDVTASGSINSHYWCCGALIGYMGEGMTEGIKNCTVTGTGDGLEIWSEYGGVGAACGLLQDGSNLESVEVKDTAISSNSNYCVGYVSGGNSGTNNSVENVEVTVNGDEIVPEDAENTTVVKVKIGDKGYGSIGAAVEAAADGDVIKVFPGVYEENIVINKSVTITGDSNYGMATLQDSTEIAKPVIKISNVNDGGVEYHAPNVTFDNLVFEVTEDCAPASTWNVSVLGYYYEIVKDREGLTVTNCDFINNSDISMSAIAANLSSYTLTGNSFVNFTSAVHSFMDHSPLGTVVVSGNTFANVENLVNAYWGAADEGTASITVADNKSTDGTLTKIVIDDFGITKETPVAAIDNVSVINNDAVLVFHNYSKNIASFAVDGSDVIYTYRTSDIAALAAASGVTGYVYVQYGTDDEQYLYLNNGVIAATAQTIYVDFENKTPKDTEGNYTVEGERTYDINLTVSDEEIINRLNSVDLTFALNTTEGAINYEIIASNDEITINPVNNSADRYEFHYSNKDNVETDTDTTITIGQVKFTGYGDFTFGVDTGVTTNAAHSTELVDNIVDSFVPGGDITAGEGVLDIDDNVISESIAIPRRTLTVKVTFPNRIEENTADYQQMSISVKGDGVDETVELGEGLAEGDIVSYTVQFGDTILNTPYTVTVEGEGYRTVKYTVAMTEEKTLNFWNNVMDNDTYVEVAESGNKYAQKVTFLAGDIVKDNNINVYDLSAVVSYFGEIDLKEKGMNTYAKYDLNRDGKIDSKDVAYVLVSWGN